jgi:hypothetical protein
LRKALQILVQWRRFAQLLAQHDLVIDQFERVFRGLEKLGVLLDVCKPLPHKAAGVASLNSKNSLLELFLDDHAVVWVAAILGLEAPRCPTSRR